MAQKKCSNCKRVFKPAELTQYGSCKLCSDCLPYYKDSIGRKVKKRPSFIDSWGL